MGKAGEVQRNFMKIQHWWSTIHHRSFDGLTFPKRRRKKYNHLNIESFQISSRFGWLKGLGTFGVWIFLAIFPWQKMLSLLKELLWAKVRGRIGHTKKCASQRSLKQSLEFPLPVWEDFFYAERALFAWWRGNQAWGGKWSRPQEEDLQSGLYLQAI